ncbi:hypothetical protein DFJ73DRAFT_784342 [Zopfochytrium polystomum]|nr:hypothetical protein DFJ73DRAFT_784342 [Zopfochytrium polystomum]
MGPSRAAATADARPRVAPIRTPEQPVGRFWKWLLLHTGLAAKPPIPAQPPIPPRIVSAHFAFTEIYLHLPDSQSRFRFATLCRLPALQAHALFAISKSRTYTKVPALQFLHRQLPTDNVMALYKNVDIDYCANRFDEDGVVTYLQSWKDSGLPLNASGMDMATAFGRIKTLQFLKDSGIPLKYSERGIDEACAVHNLDTLRWWKESGLEMKFSHRALDAASDSFIGVRILNWWRDNGLEFKYSEDAFRAASGYGGTETLQWWKDSGLEIRCDATVLKYATDDRVLDWWRDRSGTNFVAQVLADDGLRLSIQAGYRGKEDPDPVKPARFPRTFITF